MAGNDREGHPPGPRPPAVELCRAQFLDRGSNYGSHGGSGGLRGTDLKPLAECSLPAVHSDPKRPARCRLSHVGLAAQVTQSVVTVIVFRSLVWEFTKGQPTHYT